MVLPPTARVLRREITYKAVDESSPVVGSSRKIKLGLVRSSTPILALFRSPPDTPLMILFPILVLEHLLRPSPTISCSTLSLFSWLDICNLRLAENMKASLGVKVANKISSYMT